MKYKKPPVIPAKAGIQNASRVVVLNFLDTGLRRCDGFLSFV
jgi:hypothetical protein